MARPQPAKSRPENETGFQSDTVDLTAAELRAISGGNHIFLNLEINKHPNRKEHLQPPTKHHGKG